MVTRQRDKNKKKTYKQRSPLLLPFEWLLAMGLQGLHYEWAVEHNRLRRMDYKTVDEIGMGCLMTRQCARGDPGLYATTLVS